MSETLGELLDVIVYVAWVGFLMGVLVAQSGGIVCLSNTAHSDWGHLFYSTLEAPAAVSSSWPATCLMQLLAVNALVN